MKVRNLAAVTVMFCVLAASFASAQDLELSVTSKGGPSSLPSTLPTETPGPTPQPTPDVVSWVCRDDFGTWSGGRGHFPEIVRPECGPTVKCDIDNPSPGHRSSEFGWKPDVFCSCVSPTLRDYRIMNFRCLSSDDRRLNYHPTVSSSATPKPEDPLLSWHPVRLRKPMVCAVTDYNLADVTTRCGLYVSQPCDLSDLEREGRIIRLPAGTSVNEKLWRIYPPPTPPSNYPMEVRVTDGPRRGTRCWASAYPELK